MGKHRSFPLGAGARAALLCACVWGASAIAVENAPPVAMLRVDGGFMSADIRAIPLAEIARRLAASANVVTRFEASGVEELAISRHFENLAIEDALKEIFADTAYAIVRGGEGDIGYRVYVYSRLAESGDTAASADAGAAQAEVAPERVPEHAQPTVAEEAQRARLPPPADAFDDSPDDRILAMKRAAADRSEDAVGLVLTAAEDTDSSVRSASEELMLGELRDTVPVESLSRLAMTAESMDIRVRAFEALAARSGDSRHARIMIESACYDSDPEIRQRAKDLLAGLAAP